MNDLIRENVDITPFTTFGIRTKARYFAEYSCVAQLEEIMRTAEYQQSEILHIGGGSNLLFVKDFEGMVIHLEQYEYLRSGIMDVSMEEEGVDMLNFQKWYSAISRMVSAMDELLDKLINHTGIVGLN